MTAMLTALRKLETQLDSGELTPEEYARRRTRLMSAADDAEGDFIDVTPRAMTAQPKPDPVAAETSNASSAAGLGLVVVLAVMGVCMSLALVLIDNMNLALTLGVTILAAICVALLRHSEE